MTTDRDSTEAEVAEIMNLLRPRSIGGQQKVRIGGMHDGGYVVPEFAYQSNLLISIGIGEEVSFDIDFANRGAQVFQFDHTIAEAPATHPNIHFRHKGWGTGTSGSGDLLSFQQIAACADWSKAVHPVLKFDVEGAEWICLLAADRDDLERFEIIVGEFHNLEGIAWRNGYEMVRRALEKLCERHRPVHLHANNNSGVYFIHGLQVPSVIELTFLRKDCGVLPDFANEPIPGVLDLPNNSSFSDIRIQMTDGVAAGTPIAALPAGFGINLFGQFTSATGLGVTARHTAKALRNAGVPFVCFDIKAYYPTGDVAEELADLSTHIVSDPAALCFPVNLYCMPATDFPQLVQQIPQLLQQRKFHAAVVWWETTKLHTSWAQALMRLDALIAYSEFLSGVLANSLPLTPVITGRQPLFLPHGIRPDRAAFGLPDEATVFVSGFDPSSDPARKNPLGIIAAFRQAFPDNNAEVRLVFRLNNAHATDMAQQTTRMLMEAAGSDGRIGFSLDSMDYRKVLSLYASADAYVSLHRAEGLGLGMLESMRLGVPVIATGWSGNMTFMDHRCACLVRYRLVQVSGNHPFYRTEALGPDAFWAEPVIEDAIAWMHHLYKDPNERRHIGELARLRTERYQEEALSLDWLRELGEIWRTAARLPRVDNKLSVMAKTP